MPVTLTPPHHFTILPAVEATMATSRVFSDNNRTGSICRILYLQVRA